MPHRVTPQLRPREPDLHAAVVVSVSLFGFSAHTLGSNISPALPVDQGLLWVYGIFAAGGLARFDGAMALSPPWDRFGASRLLRYSLLSCECAR